MRTARVRAALVKEFRQLLRDPVLLILVLWLYTIEVAICADALTFELHGEPVAVLDFDRSSASARLAEWLDRAESFDVRYHPPGEREGRDLVASGRARMLAIIPVGYGARSARFDAAEVQLIVDGTNSLVALTALGDARRLVLTNTARESQAIAPGAVGLPLIRNDVRIWYNPGLRYVYSVVTSMIASAAFMVGVILPAASIVREKERGTLEQLLVSPLRSHEILLAKTLPTLVIGVLMLLPSLGVARLFGVPFRGGVGAFVVLSAASLVSTIAIGVVIASTVRTLQQALFVSFFVLFPVLFLSGTMTPIESMPRVLQEATRLSPLRHYAEALSGVMVKGVGLDVLWPQLVWMLGLGAAFFAVATVLFRRRIA
jgi:ABC-2 type transport system permease protein